MDFKALIQKKRDGFALTKEEIEFFAFSAANETVPDYQLSAMLMAIFFNSLNEEETLWLTDAMARSGDMADLTAIDGIKGDKHSTGGVGDKTSLVVTPIVASLGVKVAKMSGRGLGHTGGTVDKLEAIPGFKTDLPTEEFEEIVNRVGIAIVGQNATLAPADKLLYALRDVTATVDSLPLIVSSIMSKKLAADDDCVVLDVKTGSGSFMKTKEQSRELAEWMVAIGKAAGKRMRALITDMDRPLGYNIGNSLEVIEAIETLKGNGPEDLTELSVALAAHMLVISDRGNYDECERNVRRAIESGDALMTFANMVEAQGGNKEWILNPTLFPEAPYSYEVKSKKAGYITGVNTEGYGVASLLLGAGRNTMADKIDFSAGIKLVKKTGDKVQIGDTLAVLYTSDEGRFEASKGKLLESTFIGDEKPVDEPLILDIVE